MYPSPLYTAEHNERFIYTYTLGKSRASDRGNGSERVYIYLLRILLRRLEIKVGRKIINIVLSRARGEGEIVVNLHNKIKITYSPRRGSCESNRAPYKASNKITFVPLLYIKNRFSVYIIYETKKV